MLRPSTGLGRARLEVGRWDAMQVSYLGVGTQLSELWLLQVHMNSKPKEPELEPGDGRGSLM